MILSLILTAALQILLLIAYNTRLTLKEKDATRTQNA